MNNRHHYEMYKNIPKPYYSDFINENQYDLAKLYDMLTNRVETGLKFEDFCRFVYKKTLYMF